MRIRTMSITHACLISSALLAQLPQTMDLQALRQAAQAGQGVGVADAAPAKAAHLPPQETPAADKAIEESEARRLDREIREMKAREKGPRRFGADLFEVRQATTAATEGGVSEDYVLGVGDELLVNVFGSATFDVPVRVDGKGEVVIPKVGSVKVAGRTLGQAKQAVQALVERNFSRSTVELQVVKLREVRVFVLGEVYKPGAYLVSSLSSLVNVLSLVGGPTPLGSYRDIRVMRGGRLVHRLDLYPLRTEGLGNANFALQSGDTVFVPLAGTTVLLEGGFVRVMPQNPEAEAKIAVQAKLKAESDSGSQKLHSDTVPLVKSREQEGMALPEGDAASNALPLMQFELLDGETALDAVRFAGGLLPSTFPDALSLRRQDREGLTSMLDIPFVRLGQTPLKRGDVISAFPRRDRLTRMESVIGWVRVPGSFGRPDGLRVGDLLKRDHQVLPDTYLERAEITRTLEDGRVQLLTFNVAKALEGDPANNLLLEDRDRIELFSLQRMRLPKTVSVTGPFTTPGTWDWHEGMRASDLVFRAGVPKLSADRYHAELAHMKDGKVSQVIRMDLSKLLSTEASSPVGLADEASNPLVQPYDQLNLYEKPDFRVHRSARIQGLVAHPGTYVFDEEKPTLSQLIARAGGLLPNAMPKAGVFLRDLKTGTEGRGIGEILDRLSETKMVPPSSGAALPGGTTTTLFKPPVLHGLSAESINRLVVDFDAALKGDRNADVELRDGDEIIIPRKIDAAYIVGETASPFATYKAQPGMKVRDLVKLAGGYTRNADTWNVRLLKADGRIQDSWIGGKPVEPGDVVLVPQRFRRDSSWQENLQALTPIALILNAIWR